MSDPELFTPEPPPGIDPKITAPAPEEDRPAEPEPAAEPVAEATADAEPVAEQQEEQTEHTAPVGVVKELRDKNRELRADMDRLLKDMQPAIQQLTAAEQRRQQEAAQANAPAVPDPQKQPYEHMLHKVDQIGDRLTQREQQDQRAQAFNAYNQRLSSDEQAFRQTSPDFVEAVGFLKDTIVKEGELAGVPPHEMNAFVDHSIQQFNLRMMGQNRNTAQAAYDLARLRGYQPATPTPGNGAATVPSAPAQPPANTIARQAANRQAAGGGMPSGGSVNSMDTVTDVVAAIDSGAIKGDAVLKAYEKLRAKYA